LSDVDVFDVAYDLHKRTLVGFGSKRTLRTVGIPVSDRQNYKDTSSSCGRLRARWWYTNL